MKRTEPIFAWMPAAAWAFVILVFSIIPGGDLTFPEGWYLDKWIHFFEYFILALLLVRGARYIFNLPPTIKESVFILILGGGYGILMELIQWFVPGREFSAGDGAANIAGMVFGIILGKGVIWRK